MLILVVNELLLQEWECHLEDHLHRSHCSVLELIVDDDICFRLQVFFRQRVAKYGAEAVPYVTVLSWYS